MSLKKSIFVTIILLLSVNAIAQRGGRRGGDYNRLGLQGGYSIFDIKTDNFETQSNGGFVGGFTTRGSYRNNFDLIYGLNFMSHSVGIAASVTGTGEIDQSKTFLEYTIVGAQLNLLASYNIIKHHLSIEAGPLLQFNSKMKLKDERFSTFKVQGYNTLTAGDIQEISTINAATILGITGGIENFRLSAQYQLGLTNFLGGLNDQNLEFSDFKGYTSTIVIAGVVYF